MLTNVTITLPEEVARWVRVKAAEDNLSMSKLVGKILEAQMARGEDYKEAHRRWKKVVARQSLKIDAEHRLPREEANARR